MFSDLKHFDPVRGSGKTGLRGLAVLVCLLGLAACASDSATSTGPGDSARGVRPGEIAVGSDGLTGLDLGDDWDQSIRDSESQRGGSGTLGAPMPSASTLGANGPSPGNSPGSASGAASTPEGGTWAIVLFTYTRDNHAQIAAEAAAKVRALGPEFATVRPHTDDKGSMVLFGSYPSHDDPEAQTDLARLRATMTPDGRRRVFPRVILTYIEPTAAALPANDLRNVRQMYGANRELYTLDVAVWSTFGDPKLNYENLKGQAEAYCRQLRAAGYEAYYHHNERSEISNVTVGVFGHGAVDPQSGIYSAEVMALVKQFPSRLNNGQPLQVPADRFHPERGMRPQPPVLVEVPE